MKTAQLPAVRFFIFNALSKAVSRVMSCVIICLGPQLPAVSSDLPESATGRRIAFCLILLRMGFTLTRVCCQRGGSLLHCLFTLAPQKRGGNSLLHFPGSHLRRTLSGILPFEARTFLTWQKPAAITRPTQPLCFDSHPYYRVSVFHARLKLLQLAYKL